MGAFTQWDNAVNLRNRLARESLGVISIQPPQEIKATVSENTPLYRVRVGPLASVEEGDRLTERIVQLGVTGVRIVVE